MRPEPAFVFQIARAYINGAYPGKSANAIPDRFDWELFKGCLLYHGIGGMAFPVLDQSGDSVQADILAFVKNQYYLTLMRSQLLWKEFLIIAKAFNRAHIAMVPLKGIALLAGIYRDMPLRTMRDIDILVAPRDLSAARSVIESLDYTLNLDGLKPSYWYDHFELQFTRRHAQKTMHVDLHYAFSVKQPLAKIVPALWDRSRITRIDDTEIRLPSIEDIIVGLAVHQRTFGNPASQKNPLDLALIMKKYSGKIDWDYLTERARAGQITACLYFLCLRTACLFQTAFPVDLRKRLHVTRSKHARMEKNVYKHLFPSHGIQQAWLDNHFLLYDDWFTPIRMVIAVPQEQFAKFYHLRPYATLTMLLYHTRPAYILYRTLKDLAGKVLRPR